MDNLTYLKRKAEWAERKADEAAASYVPWARGNLRLYQNMVSKFWGEFYAAEQIVNNERRAAALAYKTGRRRIAAKKAAATRKARNGVSFRTILECAR